MNFNYRHPYYLQRAKAWTWALHHWTGGRELKESNTEHGYLRQFWTEIDADFEERLDRSETLYDNIVRRALKVYQSQIFRVNPRRGLDEGTELSSIESDIDLYGTHADQFFERVLDRADLFEMCGVLVDAPDHDVERQRLRVVRTDGEAVDAPPSTEDEEKERERGRQEEGDEELPPEPFSEAEVRESGMRPWAEIITPLQIVDWGVETQDMKRRGMLNYIVIWDQIREYVEPLEPSEMINRYRVYTTDHYQEWHVKESEAGSPDATGSLVKDKPHEFGEVPLVMFYSEFLSPMKGSTIFDDVVMSANALWNTMSVMDEAFHYQGFNTLVITSDEDLSDLKLGETKAVKLPAGSEFKYEAPVATPFQMGEERMRGMLERVADLVFNRTSRQIPTAQVESAQKRMIDREEFVALLETKAARMELGERKVWELLAKATGAQDYESEVTYNRVFNVDFKDPVTWMQEVSEGISSKAEWYMATHPEVTDEDEAWRLIEENLKRNAQLTQAGFAQDRLKKLLGIEEEEEDEDEGEGDDSAEGEGGSGEGEGGEGQGQAGASQFEVEFETDEVA